MDNSHDNTGRPVRRTSSHWFWFALFALAWLALRVFWLDGDTGIPALWEYGFNVTDEGYYMGAGKDKFLTGAFCDFTRNESFTYGYSPLTHWLSYAGYCLFGLSDWAWRLPFVTIYFIAWLMIFLNVQKQCGNVRAFVLCTLFASLPVTVAYERVACNDVLIAALGAIAFCLSTGKAVWRIFAAAFVVAAISLVKPSVYVVFPIVAAGILMERKTRHVWLDLILFVVAAIASLWIWKFAALASLWPEAARHGLSAAEIVRRTTTHNALPSLLDYDQLLRGFSSFPRDVCFKAFSGVGVLMTAVPLSLAAIDILRKKWTGRTLLYLAVCAYIAGISVNNSICLHYYHPVLLMLPILLVSGWTSWKDSPSDRAVATKTPLATADQNSRLIPGMSVLAIAGSALIAFFALSTPHAPQETIGYFSTISNLPQKIVWGMNGFYAVLVGGLAVLSLGFIRGVKATLREGAIWFVCAFVATSVALSPLAILTVARYVHLKADDYLLPMAMTLVIGMAWLLIAFGLGDKMRHRLFQWFVPSVIILCFALTPSWRAAIVELLQPVRHSQREVASEIAKLAPTNSVVIGERSTQVLMGKAYRAATTMPGCNPIPIVKKLFAANPNENVYALLDSQNAYNLQHFQKHKDDYSLVLLKTFKMASFGTSAPADVYFCRVRPVEKKAKK